MLTLNSWNKFDSRNVFCFFPFFSFNSCFVPGSKLDQDIEYQGEVPWCRVYVKSVIPRNATCRSGNVISSACNEVSEMSLNWPPTTSVKPRKYTILCQYEFVQCDASDHAVTTVLTPTTGTRLSLLLIWFYRVTVFRFVRASALLQQRSIVL